MWNLLSCNSSYQTFLIKKEKKRLKDSLGQVTPTISSDTQKFSKISRNGTKKLRIRQDSQSKIEQSNQILLKKMIEINNNPSKLNQSNLKPRCLSSISLNIKSRMDSHNRILYENRKILERLQSTQSVYSAEKWENAFKQHEWIKNTHLKPCFRIVEERKKLSRSVFELCDPGVFENLKLKFYENYE